MVSIYLLMPRCGSLWLGLATIASTTGLHSGVRHRPLHEVRPRIPSAAVVGSIRYASDSFEYDGSWQPCSWQPCSSSSSGGGGGGGVSSSSFSSSSRRRSEPRMAMNVAALMAADARMLAATIGGLFAGGLHAVTGPDHLAALLPLCMSRRWWVALSTGAYWGLGHGIGAALVGALAFAVRGALNLDRLSSYMEAAVGISIVIIGVNGIRESREWANEASLSMAEGPTENAKQHSLEVALSQPPKAQTIVSTLLTGILHGCSGSGHLLGVMPALTMPTWRVAATYLVSFGLGTMAAMSLFTGVVGELSSRMSDLLDDPRTPGRLALASSVFAVLMGSAWTGKALASFGWAPAVTAAVRLLAS